MTDQRSATEGTAFWNSRARLVRTEEPDATGPIGEGSLREMVEMFLAQPDDQRHTLRLEGEVIDHRGLDLTQVQQLHAREDFPGAY